MNGILFPYPQGGPQRDPAPRYAQCTSSFVGDIGKPPHNGHYMSAPCHQDRCLAIGDTLHGQLDGAGGSGMSQLPIPLLWT